MALKRMIPCLLFDGTGLVKTVGFRDPTYVGDPINAIRIFNDKEVDELILLDINATKQRRKPDFEKIGDMAAEAFMPFAYGGGVKTYEDFAALYRIGVEKVIVNSLIAENPAVIKEVVRNYGAQAVVACVDFRKNLFGRKKPYSHVGARLPGDILSYAEYLEEDLGVGEIMLQSVDRDGTWSGYDDEINRQVIAAAGIPVIVAGGCGTTGHLRKALYETNASAAAVGSMAVYSKKGMGVLISFPAREEVVKE